MCSVIELALNEEGLIELLSTGGEYLPAVLAYNLLNSEFTVVSSALQKCLGGLVQMNNENVISSLMRKRDLGMALVAKLAFYSQSRGEKSGLLTQFVRCFDEVVAVTVWGKLKERVASLFYQDLLGTMIADRLHCNDDSVKKSAFEYLTEIVEATSSTGLLLEIVYYLLGKDKGIIGNSPDLKPDHREIGETAAEGDIGRHFDLVLE